jgi:hypothetical protein
VRWRKGTGHRSSSLSLLRARSIPRHSRQIWTSHHSIPFQDPEITPRADAASHSAIVFFTVSNPTRSDADGP